MIYEQAAEYAKTISLEYGHAVIFREPGLKESYQAMISGLPLGSAVVAIYDGGKEKRSLPRDALSSPNHAK